jgi:hypothetical protein
MKIAGHKITTAHFEELGAYLFTCLVLGIVLGAPAGLALLLVFILGHGLTFLIYAFAPDFSRLPGQSEARAMRIMGIVNGLFGLALVVGVYMFVAWQSDDRGQHTVIDFVRDNPSCTSFSNGCVVCEKAVGSDAADAVCSTPGIACTPEQFKCNAPVE